MAVTIPKPLLKNADPMNVAVNQHMIPRCYMKAWGYNKKKTSVWIYDKEKSYSKSLFHTTDWKICSKPTEKINAIDNFHDLKAGSIYLPPDALREIFEPLLSIVCVQLDGDSLDTEEKLWKGYRQFDRWVVTDMLGTPLTEDELDDLKIYFRDSRYTFVETEWSYTYENDWHNFINSFEAKVRRNNVDKRMGKNITDAITKDEIDKLMRYAVIYNFRSVEGSEEFNKILESVDIYQCLKEVTIPKTERIHSDDKTAADEFRHAKRVKDFIDFLKFDTGTLKTFLLAYEKNLEPYIWLTDSGNPFITSNEPSFTYIRKDKLKEMIFVASPTMLVSFIKGCGNNYYVEDASDEKVKEYNKVIAERGNIIIVPNQNYDIQSLLKMTFFSRLIYSLKNLFVRNR